jgi:hypothetical protein
MARPARHGTPSTAWHAQHGTASRVQLWNASSGLRARRARPCTPRFSSITGNGGLRVDDSEHTAGVCRCGHTGSSPRRWTRRRRGYSTRSNAPSRTSSPRFRFGVPLRPAPTWACPLRHSHLGTSSPRFRLLPQPFGLLSTGQCRVRANGFACECIWLG